MYIPGQFVAIILIILTIDYVFDIRKNQKMNYYFLSFLLMLLISYISKGVWQSLFLVTLIVISFEDMLFKEVNGKALILLLLFFIFSKLENMKAYIFPLLILFALWLVYQKLATRMSIYIGHGDIDLLLILSLSLGLSNIFQYIYILSLITLFVLLPLILLKRVHLNQTIPYIPFLSISYIVYLIY